MADEVSVPVVEQPAPPPEPPPAPQTDYVVLPLPPPPAPVDVEAIIQATLARIPPPAPLPPITLQTLDAAGNVISSKTYEQGPGGAVLRIKVG